jgi:hypothetical protein
MDNEQETLDRPTPFEAIKAVVADMNVGNMRADRIVIRILASGEVPYRVYPADPTQEYEGGVARTDEA